MNSSNLSEILIILNAHECEDYAIKILKMISDHNSQSNKDRERQENLICFVKSFIMNDKFLKNIIINEASQVQEICYHFLSEFVCQIRNFLKNLDISNITKETMSKEIDTNRGLEQTLDVVGDFFLAIDAIPSKSARLKQDLSDTFYKFMFEIISRWKIILSKTNNEFKLFSLVIAYLKLWPGVAVKQNNVLFTRDLLVALKDIMKRAESISERVKHDHNDLEKKLRRVPTDEIKLKDNIIFSCESNLIILKKLFSKSLLL